MQVQSAQNAVSREFRQITFEAEDFFKLLVAQLRYQDPMNPVEDREFIAQTAQFSQLSESRRSNELLEALLLKSHESPVSLADAARLIGKWVSADVYGSAVSGTVTGVKMTGATIGLVLDDQSIVFPYELVEIRQEV